MENLENFEQKDLTEELKKGIEEVDKTPESTYRRNLAQLSNSELGKVQDKESKEFMLSSLLFLVGWLGDKDKKLYDQSFSVHDNLLNTLMWKSWEDAKNFLKGIYDYKKEARYDEKIYNIIDNLGGKDEEKNAIAIADRESILLDNKALQLATKLGSFDALSGNHTDVAAAVQN